MRYLVALSMLVLVSCGPSVRITLDYRAQGFEITKLKGARARLYVQPTVDVLQFRYSFDREYRTKEVFVSQLSDDLRRALNGSVSIAQGDSVEAALLFVKRSLADSAIAAQKGIFETAHEDYFIGIRKVTISNRMISSPQFYSPPTPRSPGGYWGGGVSEDCIVSIETEVWSVQDKRLVTEFTAVGSSTVFLFMYGTALTNAVEDAIVSLTRYVKENRVR